MALAFTIHPGHIRFQICKKDRKLLAALMDDVIENNVPKFKFNQLIERNLFLNIHRWCNNSLKGNQIKKVVEIIKPKLFVLGKQFAIDWTYS